MIKEQPPQPDQSSVVPFLHRKLKHKQTHCVPICKVLQSSKPVTNLSVSLNIRNMQARFEASFVISQKPYNLEEDLLLKLVGREVCHMFSIHKYWLWLSCWPYLTLVGFHFGTNLYEMCPIYPQPLSCTTCMCLVRPCSRASAVKHMRFDDEVFTGFQIKKTALLERRIRGESKQQIVPWFSGRHLRWLSRGVFVTVCSNRLRAEEC